MTKELLKAGEKMQVKQGTTSTTGLFVNYRVLTPLAPTEFDIVSAKPDSVASILANKTIVFSDELIEENNL